MILKYTNSQGKTFDLLSNGLMRLKTGNFHSYSWKAIGTTQQYGIKLDRFVKDAYEYKATIVFKGLSSQRKAMINEFHEAMTVDIINKTPGRIEFEQNYIECFIITTNTYPDDASHMTLNDIVIWAPYPFWIQKLEKQFYPQSEIKEGGGLDFSTDFPFDFASENAGTALWYVDHYAPSNFEMIIYGPCLNPRVLINGYPYQIFTELESSDYLVLDSKKHTIVKHLANGSTSNLYNSRQFSPSVFAKIPRGDLVFNWNGEFGFDLTLYIERSEPKW